MTVRDSGGNVAVDFVWGNLPLQPDDDRGGDTLDPTLDNHSIATTGYSNFPGYIPNYEGDGDANLEIVVPDFVRLTLNAANDLADLNKLNLNTIPHTLTASYVTSSGKTIRVTAYDESYQNFGNSSDAALIGLLPGDELDLSQLSTDYGTVKVTKVNNDGDTSWFEFKVATAPDPALDEALTGTVYAGPNLYNIVTVQRPNRTAPGAIIESEQNYVNVRYFAAN